MATTSKEVKPLVIVESPAKIRTISKYIGKNFKVSSTVGHIKDLPKKDIGIDVTNNFKPRYENIPDKKKVIADLKKAALNTNDIYLAQDPDREGEAIAWHTADILKRENRNFYLASRNLPNIKFVDYREVNVYDVVKYKIFFS